MMWDMGPGMGWWMGFGWIWVIGFCLVMMWAVRTLSKGSRGHQDHGSAEAETPLEILERRYARGELSDEQYEAMRQRLSRPPAPMPAVASAPDQSGPEGASTPTARVGSHPATARS
jgi:putative membrane protein